MFIVTSRLVSDVEPFDYYEGSETLSVGMAVKLSAGKLAKAAATEKPTHIVMGGANSFEKYPCIRVAAGTTFAALESVAVPGSAVGSAVTLAADGLGVTAATQGGVFTVTATDNTAGGACMGYFA